MIYVAKQSQNPEVLYFVTIFSHYNKKVIFINYKMIIYETSM